MGLRDELLVLLCCSAGLGFSLTSEDFVRPLTKDRPETEFHFVGGNVSKQGISADLQAISWAGISGVQLFHGQIGDAWTGVSPQVRCLDDKWNSMVSHVAEECKRLNLRFTMQNCPGWSTAGGPWIQPEDAMRVLAWSRLDVEGGKRADLALPYPEKAKEEWRDYQDVAILAFPTPVGDTGAFLLPQSVRCSLPTADCDAWLKRKNPILFPASTNNWLEVTFPKDVVVRSVILPSIGEVLPSGCTASDVTLTIDKLAANQRLEIAHLGLPMSNRPEENQFTIACTDTIGKTFRLTFRNEHEFSLGQVHFLSAARKENWEAEAVWTLRPLVRRDYPAQNQLSWISQGSVTNLTELFDEDGRLQWNVPKGKWTVLRIGHVNAGKRNGPSSENATGWECDKLSAEAAVKHLNGYIGSLTDWWKGPIHGKLDGVLLNSWKCGSQTWTKDMPFEFLERNGYSLEEWMPALLGYVVGDPLKTAKFLRDWRATISQMVVDNFFGTISELSHKRGFTLSVETSVGDTAPVDILEYYKHADIPGCEIRQPSEKKIVNREQLRSVRSAASAAHLYGKQRIVAQAFASSRLSWNEKLRDLKQIANRYFAQGVTHLAFHTYTHNPRVNALFPGSSMGCGIGTPFLRGQTWWKAMPEFTTYLARCGLMLEAGLPVSDVLLYLGDDLDDLSDGDIPFPEGCRFDYCNGDVLLNRLTVKNGKWTTPDGTSYSFLWIPHSDKMMPETAEALLKGLEKGGVAVLSSLPSDTPSLRGGKEAYLRLKDISEKIWGESNLFCPQIREVGEGRIVLGVSFEKAMEILRWMPDVQQKDICWFHRKDAEKDWYFVAPKGLKRFLGKVGFRCNGNVELWYPESGEIESCGTVEWDGSVTWVNLDLAPAESCFVVFRHSSVPSPAVVVDVECNGTSITTKDNSLCTIQGNSVTAWTNGLYRVRFSNGEVHTNLVHQTMRMALPGTWNVTFPDDWGIPSLIRMNPLIPWKNMNGTVEARSFSGTATYGIDFAFKQLHPDTVIFLDLGRVESIVTVFVNGHRIKTLWSYPYQVDITYAVKPGVNRLTLEVTDTWYNRLVYDAGLPVKERKTWTICPPSKDAERVESGCLGPVYLYRGVQIK